MSNKAPNKASEKYGKPRDRFYEFLERHETLSHERKKAERKGAAAMTIIFCIFTVLAFILNEEAEYALVDKIFG